jgi:peptidase M50-like protein
MICGVLKAVLYFFGRLVAGLVFVVGLCWPSMVYDGAPGAQGQFLPECGVLCLALSAGVVVHELGHLLACRAVRARVTAFRLGGDRGWVRFRAGTVQVSLAWPYRGHVEYVGAYSTWRRAVITVAGSLADLALAFLVLAGSAAVASGRPVTPFVFTVADGLAVIGLTGLLPFRTRAGELSDGAQMFELPAGIAVSRLVAAGQAASRLRQDGRVAQLLELHAGLEVPGGRLGAAQAASVALVEFSVALLPGPLPEEAARLAEHRAAALARQEGLGAVAPLAYLALALLLVRGGDADGHAEAERLCQRVLAGESADDPLRRMALAAVIVSRQARGLPHADVSATWAAALSPADCSPEVMAAQLSAIFDPEAALRAFLAGDPGARLGAGTIAGQLRRQGRTGELLELHAGFGKPEGPHELEQARSLECVAYNVLLEPGLPPGVLGEAASRVEWIAARYPHAQNEGPEGRAALEHTLALARLRQGRFAEVEPLCAPALAVDVGADNRATVLATIALGRRALGQPYAGLVTEAVALAPDADLVPEAQQAQSLAEASQPC